MIKRELVYKIIAWNAETKTLDVQFEDHGWARVQLRVPLPKNMEELEAEIIKWAPSIEMIDAMTDETDLSYIDQHIGKLQSAERYTFQVMTSPDPVDDVDMTEIENSEREFVLTVLNDRLQELGLIK